MRRAVAHSDTTSSSPLLAHAAGTGDSGAVDGDGNGGVSPDGRRNVASVSVDFGKTGLHDADHESDWEGSPKSSGRAAVYHSDSAISEVDKYTSRGTIMKRLPMIPSRARFPVASRKGVPSNKLPRKIPRRIKGKYRRIVANRSDSSTGRIAVYCECNEIDLDQVYGRILQVRQELGSDDVDIPIEIQDENFSIENNKSTIFPRFKPFKLDNRLVKKESTAFKRDTVDDPSWMTSIFFDVLHLRQRNSGEGNGNAQHVDKRKPSGRRKDERAYGRNVSDFEEFEEYDSDTEAGWRYHDETHLNYREVFVFGFGCVVLWNWDGEDAEKRFIRSLTPFCRRFYEQEATDSAADDMEYFYGSTSRVKNDTVELASGDPIERLAVSFAFAQSSLLSVYEARLDQIIERNEHIPIDLAKHGKIHMSQEEISKEMGRLFMERNMINLESDILGTPEFFWQNDELEPVYKKMCNYMEQDERHEILNKRLDCVRELLDVLATQVENQHASKLEWIIIWLILSELIVQVVWGVFIKDILGFFNHCNSD